jgi:hypothetical protein
MGCGSLTSEWKFAASLGNPVTGSRFAWAVVGVTNQGSDQRGGITMNVTLDTSVGQIRANISNPESYPLGQNGARVVSAEYEDGNQGIVFLQFGDDFEYVDTRNSLHMARVHAKQIRSSYDGVEGRCIYE